MQTRKNLSATLPDIDEKRATSLIMEMLPIPGLSGKESEIQEFVKKKLHQAGVPRSAIKNDSAHRRSPLGGEVGNLSCTFPGTIKGPRRLLMAHLDTVPLCAGTKPVRQNGFVRSGNPATGLGADNRSGVSAILNAALEIKRRNLPHPPLTFFFPVQEEVGLFGARFADVKLLGSPKLCFNWDGNEPHKVIIGATGAYRIHIEITGLASHAGVAPEKGVSAIAIAGLAIASLQSNGWHGQISKTGKQGTSNIGFVNGGGATNVVTDKVSIKAEARSHDPKLRKQIVDAFKNAFAQAVKQVRSKDGTRGKLSFRADLHYESFKMNENSASILEAERVIKAAGDAPELKICNGGLDANWMSAHGLPTVTLGAGQQDVHTVNETLILSSYLKGCQIALALATGS
jgi:tripeptide aminopeptidase